MSFESNIRRAAPVGEPTRVKVERLLPELLAIQPMTEDASMAQWFAQCRAAWPRDSAKAYELEEHYHRFERAMHYTLGQILDHKLNASNDPVKSGAIDMMDLNKLIVNYTDLAYWREVASPHFTGEPPAPIDISAVTNMAQQAFLTATYLAAPYRPPVQQVQRG